MTVCFETKTDVAAERKQNIYASLAYSIKPSKYRCKLYTIVIGSRCPILHKQIK